MFYRRPRGVGLLVAAGLAVASGTAHGQVAEPPSPMHGFGFSGLDGADSLLVHWLVQSDAFGFVTEKPPGVTSRDTFTIGFAGLQLDATLQRIFHSSILVDFSQSRLTLLDATVEARIAPELVIRVGKFATPINEERITPKLQLPWISVSPASFLLPVRETGLELQGDLGPGLVTYNVALSNGSFAGPVTDNDVDSGKDVIGRIYSHPFHATGIAALAQLGVGFGASYGIHRGTQATPETPALRTYGNAVFFAFRNDGTPAGTVLADGGVTRLVPHLTYAYGPLAAYADYTRELDGFGATTVGFDAVSATVTIALTGEHPSPFGRIAVIRPIDLARGDYGGVQLVMGGGEVRVGSAAFTAGLANPATSMQRADVLGGGVNWYPVNGLGVLVDVSRTSFTAFAGSASRPGEITIYGRLELSL